ncbi:radical SAM protein [Paludibacter sp. 221]|uniref:radical SAM protein n=1 Tax=Paludibacter sp. 221 TaxID=2302939 RepID=UPI0013D31927|nr:radical SAM protein [Paludibacter sp. 221]NDV47348.1 radical SAM protein [Paludibacter sp. 221]
MSTIKKLIPYRLILFRRKLLPFVRKVKKKNSQRKDTIPILHLHLTDHCNLNCRGCDNFSPLAPATSYADIEVFEKDCTRIAKLMEGRIDEIQLLGGEPLLHPKIIDFMEITRKCFPNTPINIVSNGLLLPKQTTEFWESCRKNDIHIIVTKYPVKLDYKKIEQHVRAQGVAFSYYGNTEKVDKTMQCIPLDVEGKQDARDSFLRCSRANRCISLDGGKIYTCSLIPYVKYFNKHFNKDLVVSPADYIDIYEAKSGDEILDFVSKPVPFCRYCNIKGTIWDIGFGVSKKDISEWTGASK